jgi:hypothetical protein
MVSVQRTEGSGKNELNGSGLATSLTVGRWRDIHLCNRTVTEDQSLVHHYQPESKRVSVQWKQPSSPSAKKFKVTPSARKVMLIVFWDYQRVLWAHFQKCGGNVNSASYCEVLLKLRDAIGRKPPGQLARGVLRHHDNSRPHTTQATQVRI